MSGLIRAGSPYARAHGHTETTGYLSTELVCRGCGAPLPVQRHPGNPRRWCSERCRIATHRRNSQGRSS